MEQIQQDPPPTKPIHPSSSATTNTNYNGASEPLSWQTLEDANAHLQNFLEICNTILIQGVPQDAIRLRVFPFLLLKNAKHWFYTNSGAMDTWEKCSNDFLVKFFPVGRANLFHSKISNFQ